jgi:predicted MFS family arabinose efflux permease
MAWAVPLAGSKPGKALVWVGIAIYAAMALGAPLGVWGASAYGLGGVALLLAGTSVAACLVAALMPAVPVIEGARISTLETMRRVWRPGLGLALSGTGYAVIAAFIALYYQAKGWENAAYALTAFGIGLIAARLFFGGWPDRFGGAPVAVGALTAEIAGQLLLWLAPVTWVALVGAALTGIGYSLAFPSLAIEAVKRVPPQNRGAALGAYVVCLDVALAATGPLAGLLVQPFGYPSVFLLGAIGAALSTAIAVSLLRPAAGGW